MSTHGVRPRQHGFSMIEAMVAIAILAIGLALGMPAMGEAVQNARIRSASESILAGLQTARAEAVRRNIDVQFAFATTDGTDWSVTLRSQEVLQSSIGEGSAKVTATTDGG